MAQNQLRPLEERKELHKFILFDFQPLHNLRVLAVDGVFLQSCMDEDLAIRA